MDVTEVLFAKEQEKQRLDKLRNLKEKGIHPYPIRFNKKNDIDWILKNGYPENTEESVTVKTAGRVKSKRDMGKASFFVIEDDTGSIQVYSNNKLLDDKDYAVLQQLDIGDIVGIEGETFRTKVGEKSIRAKSLTMLSKCLTPLPVVKEKDGKVYDAFADVEQRYRKRYVDLVVNPSVRNDFRIRSKIISFMRRYLEDRGFMEVETPMMQPIASGAAARPFITHHNTLDIDLYLRIAPELYLKRLIVGGYEKVFEINRNFRNEGISTKHNPEFTMMELYQAYADYQTMMELTEDLFEALALEIHGSTEIPYGDDIISLKKPWPRKEYLQLIQEKTGLDFMPFVQQDNPDLIQAKQMADQIGVDAKEAHTVWEVIDEVFSEKVEKDLIQPVFVTRYPKAISPLAKTEEENPLFVERFEPYITGREMGNAFSELNDPVEQYLRFVEQTKQKEAGAEETMEPDMDFIEALKTAMPPTGGLGIGIDRLVMLFTNKQSIKDVILFPLLRPEKKNA
ncbi:MAG: lysine--tRNA ligase [Candidatus Hydrogenedentota bacterium]|nr:MAG: lysine--tRNA ligase [Candidatus Hydrogenedentota bacterium]